MKRWSLVVVLALVTAFATSMAGAVAAQEASPAPTAECVAPEIPPGTPTVMDEATPMAGMEASPPAEDEAPMPVASPEIPVGEPAPDDVAAEVEATVANFAACFNASMFVEVAALHTTAGLMDECGTTNVHDGPMCFGGPPMQVTVESVSDVQVHDDGRVSADVVVKFGNFLLRERMFFVQEGDFWLLDESPDLAVEVPEGATVVTGELADYAFVLDTTSAPAGDIAFEVTNTGEYPHEIVVVQLPEGVTIEDVFADESLVEQIQFYGFSFAMPGETAPPLVMVDMEPGTYTLVCFVDEPEGVPHVARGMIAEFEVTPAE